MFGFGKKPEAAVPHKHQHGKHPQHKGHSKGSKDLPKKPHKGGFFGLFHGDIDDLSNPIEDLEPPTSLDEEVETIDSPDAVGEMGTPKEDYGQDDTGTGLNINLGSGGGGVDPFKVATFGDDDAYDGSMNPNWQMDDYMDDLPQAYQPVGPDDFNFPEQVATVRNPLVDFGSDFYPFSGPAAVMGGELTPKCRLKG